MLVSNLDLFSFVFHAAVHLTMGFVHLSLMPNTVVLFFFSSIERLYIPGNFWKIWVYVIRAYKGFPFYKIWRFTTAATLFYFWEQNAFVGWMQWSSLPRETWVHRKISFVQIFRWALFSLLGRTNCLHLSPEQGTNLSNNIYQKIVFSETDWECISRKSVQKKIKVHC